MTAAPTTNERATAPRFPIGQVTDPRLVTRIVALQATATFAGGKALSTEVSTADVLKVAAAFLKWLEGGPLP